MTAAARPGRRPRDPPARPPPGGGGVSRGAGPRRPEDGPRIGAGELGRRRRRADRRGRPSDLRTVRDADRRVHERDVGAGARPDADAAFGAAPGGPGGGCAASAQVSGRTRVLRWHTLFTICRQIGTPCAWIRGTKLVFL